MLLFRWISNEYRKDISYIINTETNVKYTSNEALMIHRGFDIEIHFNSAVKNLNNFFSRNIDDNMEYLLSINLNNFDS